VTTTNASPLPLLPKVEEGATKGGGYFVANYPPFNAWSSANVPAAAARLEAAAPADKPLGLYVHIPFCRKRCRFCYYKVYTGQNAREVADYVETVVREARLWKDRPYIAGRKPNFIYFGGGTPSYLSADQIQRFAEALSAEIGWDAAEEFTFECEPGTVNAHKFAALKKIGVTRISLGVEDFNDSILDENGRAHRSKQVFDVYEMARAEGFEQVNIDLIAGMLGGTDESWARNVEHTLALAPESVTIYQMEVPWNSGIAAEMKALGLTSAPVPDWATKRRWVDEAFRAFEKAGYVLWSGYTMVKPGTRFQYTGMLWHGADMLGLGVSAFGHLGGAHLQNEKEIEAYKRRVDAGEIPLQRGLACSPDALLTREAVLQLKMGRMDHAYFQRKFGVDTRQYFAEPIRALETAGLATAGADRVQLTREALLRVDALLPAFYQAEYRPS
jgi:oxygen-independent coproporphyrinogen-3 oxidase